MAPVGLALSDQAFEMSSPATKTFGPDQCPLCGQANDCRQCTNAAYRGPCWCERVDIPEALLARVPLAARNQSCICRTCVMAFHRSNNSGAPEPKILPGDFYFDNGLMVFTAIYHRRRGYCCDSGCRHCPYETVSRPPAAS
jgi:hypothetical protein